MTEEEKEYYHGEVWPVEYPDNYIYLEEHMAVDLRKMADRIETYEKDFSLQKYTENEVWGALKFYTKKANLFMNDDGFLFYVADGSPGIYKTFLFGDAVKEYVREVTGDPTNGPSKDACELWIKEFEIAAEGLRQAVANKFPEPEKGTK